MNTMKWGQWCAVVINVISTSRCTVTQIVDISYTAPISRNYNYYSFLPGCFDSDVGRLECNKPSVSKTDIDRLECD